MYASHGCLKFYMGPCKKIKMVNAHDLDVEFVWYTYIYILVVATAMAPPSVVSTGDVVRRAASTAARRDGWVRGGYDGNEVT